MTIKAIFSFQNNDSTADLNSRYADLIKKGFFLGGAVTPVPLQLKVDVAPFKAVSFDGMVLEETVSTRLTVVAGQTNYVVLRAKHSNTQAPTVQWEVLEASVYLADPDIDYLIIKAVIVLAPSATQVLTSNISLVQSDWTDPLTRFVIRGTLTNAAFLPATNNRVADAYIITDGTGDSPNLYVYNGLIFVNITQAGSIASLLTLHRQNLFSNEIHLTDNQASALIGTSGTPPSLANPYVDNADPRIPTQNENNALVGVANTTLDSAVVAPSSTNKFITESRQFAIPHEVLSTQPSTPVTTFAPTILALSSAGGPFWVGNGGLGTAQRYFSLFDSDALQRKGYINSVGQSVRITGVFVAPTVSTVSTYARTSGVVTIVTTAAHGFSGVVPNVTIRNITPDASFNITSATVTEIDTVTFTYVQAGGDVSVTPAVTGEAYQAPVELNPGANGLVAGKGFFPNDLWLFTDNPVDLAYALAYGLKSLFKDIPPDSLIKRGPQPQLDVRATYQYLRYEVFPVVAPQQTFVLGTFSIIGIDECYDIDVKENGMELLPDDGSFAPIVIVAGVNDKLDFSDSTSTVRVITIAAGTYSTLGQLATLATTIASDMTTATSGVDTITGAFAGKSTPTFVPATDFKFTFTSNNSPFSLLFGSGVNALASIGRALGFTSTDHTGASTYTSDNEIDRGYVGYSKVNNTTIHLKRPVAPRSSVKVTKLTIGDT